MPTFARKSSPRTRHTLLRVEGLEDRSTPAAGALDPAFSGDGLARFGYDEANDAVLQPDGKIVLVGSVKATNGFDDFAVLRLNPDGSRDNTFGSNGMAQIPFDTYIGGNDKTKDVAHAVALLPDGRIVVAGKRYDPAEWEVINGVVTKNGEYFAIAVLNPNGSPDNSFWVAGRLHASYNGGVSDIVVQPDGKVVAIGNVNDGTTGGQNIHVLRIDPNKKGDDPTDYSFGTNGSKIIAYNFGDSKNEFGAAVALQPDGKIVIAGSIDSSSHDFEVAVIRLNPNGSQDNTFDGNGLRQVELDFGGGGHDYAAGMAIQPDGKIVVAASGQTDTTTSGQYNLAVIRLNSNGSSDASFGTGGVRRLDAGLDVEQNHFPVALQPDGKIVVGAVSHPVNGMNGYYIARLNPNGTSDPTFGSGGSVTITPPGAASDDNYLGAILLQPDGKLVLVGTTDTDSATGDEMAVARLLGANEPVVVGPATLPGGQVGSGYGATVTASGPSGPFAFTVTAGALPPGLALGTDGSLAGTPTADGEFAFTVTATSATTETGSRAYTVTVSKRVPVVVHPESLPGGFERSPYAQSLIASGPAGPFAFTVTAGALPPGLTLSSAGALTGTPTAAGTFAFTVQAATGAGDSGSRAYTLAVAAVGPVVVQPASLPDGRVGSTYAQSLTASGPPGPFAFTVTAGALPPGLTLSSAGALTGTPTAAGTFAFTVQAATGAGDSGSRAYTLAVAAVGPVVVQPASLPRGFERSPYTQSLTASGLPGPYTFAVTAGAAPGLTLSSAGALTGTPTTAGTFAFTVRATTSTGDSGSRTYTLGVAFEDVIAPGSVLVGGLPDGTARPLTLSGQQYTLGNPLNFFAGVGVNVRVATADVNGDGVPDWIGGAGPGGSPRVAVLDGRNGVRLADFLAFEGTFVGGVYVAAGDVTGDGMADLVITPDEGGGPRVRILSGDGFGVVVDFFGIDDTNFRGGARAAIADLNRDNVGDLVVAAGFGGGPRIAAFDGLSLRFDRTPRKLFNDFFMFEQTLRNGVFIAAGDLDGDGFAEVIAGGGPGGGPRVFALSGKGLVSGNQEFQLANFFGGNPDSRGGIRVTVKDLDGDNRADIVVGAGSGAGSRVTGYLGRDIGPAGTPPAAFDVDAFPGFAGGVFVG